MLRRFSWPHHSYGSDTHPIANSLEEARNKFRTPADVSVPIPEDSAPDVDQGAIDGTPTNQGQFTQIPRSQVSVKLKQLRWKITFWVSMIPLTVVLFVYFYDTLLAERPRFGRLFSPSDANVVVSVLSQTFAQLIQALLMDVPDVLRWQLASRPEGISRPTFLQLSGATQSLGSIMLFTLWGKHLFDWQAQYIVLTAFRLLLPLLSVFLGNVLKCKYILSSLDAKIQIFY
jgi:hypothetical protein